jgi:hypothetical protein
VAPIDIPHAPSRAGPTSGQCDRLLSGDTIAFGITGHKWGMSKTVHRPSHIPKVDYKLKWLSFELEIRGYDAGRFILLSGCQLGGI